MERREFFKKLTRSLLTISAVAASGYVLSDKTENSAEGCPPDKDCQRCQKASGCGFPQRKSSNVTELVGPPMK